MPALPPVVAAAPRRRRRATSSRCKHCTRRFSIDNAWWAQYIYFELAIGLGPSYWKEGKLAKSQFPDFYDPQRIGTLYYLDVGAAAAATALSDLRPADEDEATVHLLIVDMENDVDFHALAVE